MTTVHDNEDTCVGCGMEYQDCGCLICGECLYCDCTCYDLDEAEEIMED